jgi:hypothetical protein
MDNIQNCHETQTQNNHIQTFMPYTYIAAAVMGREETILHTLEVDITEIGLICRCGFVNLIHLAEGRNQ